MLIEKPDQAGALLHPLRLELLKLTDEPRTCTDLVEERKVRAISEGYYQATARSFWLSPRLVGRIGGPRRARDQMSLGFLLSLAEELQNDVGRLAETEREEAPTLGFTAQVRLAQPADRTAFLTDFQNSIPSIAKKYGAVGPPSLQSKETSPETFRIIFACYPRPEES